VDSRLTDAGEDEYKVRWKGFAAEDDTWEPPDNLGSCPEKLQDYKERQRRDAPQVVASPRSAPRTRNALRQLSMWRTMRYDSSAHLQRERVARVSRCLTCMVWRAELLTLAKARPECLRATGLQVIMPARHPDRIDYDSSAWSCGCRSRRSWRRSAG
jgi:hypothetical protein